MHSIELQILITAIKVVLLNKPKEELIQLLKNPSIDWQRLSKMSAYHHIRPVVYEAFRQIDFRNDFTENLSLFSKNQSIRNLVNSHETTSILTFLNQHNIPALPYKGSLFLEKLYQNKPLRESGDIDIIVAPENALKALKLLLNDGYHLSIINDKPADEFIEQFLKRTQSREIGLDKTAKMGVNIHIDFHWGINETFHQYEINVANFFEEATVSSFQGKPLLIPSSTTIFKMLLNHHGGRGCWLRLKDFCDLIAYKKAYPEINLDNIAENMRMKTVFENGRHILDVYFYEKINNQAIHSMPTKQIINFWENAEHYDKTLPRIAFNRIYRLLQDIKPTWWSYLLTHIKYYSVPNAGERKRLFVFPDNYIFLNASSKLLSHILFRLSTSNLFKFSKLTKNI